MNRSAICLTVLLIGSCAISCLAAPIQWGANGHYYDVVAVADRVTWNAARTSAVATIVHGVPGDLASITSQAEQNFIVGTFGDLVRAKWLGGFQAPASPEPAGGWGWVSGEPFLYKNWEPTEPNNSGGHENHMTFATAGSAVLGVWNDLDGVNPPAGYVNGYVVEIVPEPSAIMLAGMGLCGLSIWNWRRRR